MAQRRTAAEAFKKYWRNIVNSAVTIFEGMSVTLSWCFRRPMTIQYPDRTPEGKRVADMLPEDYRGFLEVDIDICTGCALCSKTCPIECIDINVERVKELKKRFITRFNIDLSRCMYCGLCSEPCPTKAIRHTREFEAATPHVINLVVRFVDEPIEVFKQKKGVIPDTKPLGEELGKVLRRWDAEPLVPRDTYLGHTQWQLGVKHALLIKEEEES